MALFGGDTRSVDDFWEEYKKWEDIITGHYLGGAHRRKEPDKRIAQSTVDATLTNQPIMEALPYNLRERAKKHFRDHVLRFDENFTPDMWDEVGPGGGSRGIKVGRVKMAKGAEKNDPLSFLMRQLSIQFDPSKEGMEAYSFGQNVFRSDYLKGLYEGSQASIKAGSSITVFDVETMGLALDSGMTEISTTQMKKTGKRFIIDTAGSATEKFPAKRAGLGGIYDKTKNKIVRMDDWAQGAFSSEASGSGTEFIKKLIPVLTKMRDSDYIAGHNVGFDLMQTLVNATRTSEYQNMLPVAGVNVRTLVDSVLAKVKKGEVIDTLVRARSYFGDEISLAPELRALRKPSAYSIQNLMLETNLSQLLEQDFGPEFIDKLIAGGQHQAEVDVPITAKLLEYMDDQSGKRLKVRKLGATGDLREMALRRSSLKTYAPTPMSQIVDAEDVAPGLFQRLYEDEPDSIKIMRIGDTNLLPPEALEAGHAMDWYHELGSPTTEFTASVDVTGMEQHIFDTRSMPATLDTSEDTMLNSLGSWRRYAGIDKRNAGILNRDQTLFSRGFIPPDESFAKFQKSMLDAGMPFSGISEPERILTGAFASSFRVDTDVQHALEQGNKAAITLGNIGEDLGVSHFQAQDKFFLSGHDVASIPLDVMHQAEKEQVIGSHFLDDQLQMLSVSGVESSESINLRYNFENQEEAENLFGWMRTSLADVESESGKLLRRRGLSLETIDEMQGALIDRAGYRRGVNVAFSRGKAGQQKFRALTDLFQGQIRDEDKLNAAVGYMGTTSADSSVVQTGAVVVDRMWDKGEKEVYAEDLKLAGEKSARLITHLGDTGKAIRAHIMYQTGMGDLAETADKIYSTVTKHGPKVLAATAILAGGLFAWRRKKEQDKYDETINRQPIQKDSDYAKYRKTMGLPYAPAKRRLDPLLYAGVVGNAHNGAVQHTTMSNQKYSNLYSGVIG